MYFLFFVSCFIVSVVPSINIPDFSSDSTFLAMPSIYSFEMNKANPFPGLTSPLSFILSIANQADFVSNLGKTSLC